MYDKIWYIFGEVANPTVPQSKASMVSGESERLILFYRSIPFLFFYFMYYIYDDSDCLVAKTISFTWATIIADDYDGYVMDDEIVVYDCNEILS